MALPLSFHTWKTGTDTEKIVSQISSAKTATKHFQLGLLLILICLLIGIMLCGCGGKQSSLPTGELPPAFNEGESSFLPALPSPTELLRSSSVISTNPDLFRHAAVQWSGGLINNALPNMTMLQFSPDWNPTLSPTSDQLAYAAFQFTNLTEYAGEEGIKLRWEVPPGDYADLYLGVSDFTSDMSFVMNLETTSSAGSSCGFVYVTAEGSYISLYGGDVA